MQCLLAMRQAEWLVGVFSDRHPLTSTRHDEEFTPQGIWGA
jgi:hypothetical protein